MDEKVKKRFFAKIAIRGKDECWEWTGAKCKGHGIFNMGANKIVRSQRVIWELYNGPIPTGLFVLHKCNNRPCVNPDHLKIGTQKENVADMVKIGRGGRPGTARAVDEKLARRILGHIALGRSDRDIALRLAVRITNVKSIRENKTWVQINREDFGP